jgi:hypothetical protein
MNDEEYREYCLGLLQQFAGRMLQEGQSASADDPLWDLVSGFRQLCAGESIYEQAPELVNRLFSSCPHLAPEFPRDLLWFFGGECLHFMADEELEAFQTLDEMRQAAALAGESFDYQETRAKLLKLQ